VVVVRVSWFRKPPPPALPARVPHPDGRVEAELQRVMALQRQVARTEARVGDINRELNLLAQKIRVNYGSSGMHDLTSLSATLREERDALEAELAPLHDEISKRLADLGEDALLL
jgi:predicted  nucleic acid-binding Zn-ribbon protein